MQQNYEQTPKEKLFRYTSEKVPDFPKMQSLRMPQRLECSVVLEFLQSAQPSLANIDESKYPESKASQV